MRVLDARVAQPVLRQVEAEPRLAVLMNLARLHLQAGDGGTAAAQQALDQARALWQAQAGQWPEALQSRQLQQQRGLQLEIWVAAEAFAEAESWLAARREALLRDDWIGLVCGYAGLLAGRDRHAQAEEMLRIGYLTAVAPMEKLDAEVDALATILAGNAPVAMRGMKRAINEIARDKFDEAAAEQRHRDSMRGAEIKEGVAAYAEKRAPRF